MAPFAGYLRRRDHCPAFNLGLSSLIDKRESVSRNSKPQSLCKAKEGGIDLCNEKVSRPPRIHMLVPSPLWRGFFFGPAPPLKSARHADIAAACQKVSWGRRAADAAFREQMSPCHAKFYPSLTMVRDQERSIISPEGRLTWTRAWKSAFANAPMRSGPNMVAWTAKPSSTGLRPNEKCWRPRRPSLPANQIRTRSHGRQHVRKPPERSRGPADAAHHIRGASPLFGGEHRSFIWF